MGDKKCFSCHNQLELGKIRRVYCKIDDEIIYFPVCTVDTCSFTLNSKVSHLFGCSYCGNKRSDKNWIHVYTYGRNNEFLAEILLCSMKCRISMRKSLIFGKCSHCNVQMKLSLLKKCGKCCGVYYCSPECQGKDWETHKEKCKEYVKLIKNNIRPEEAKYICANCLKHSAKEYKCCTECKRVYYCSQECQKKDWETHKEKCKLYVGKELRTCVNCFKYSDEGYKCCSRCKKVYYCSRRCRRMHWKKEHKDNCQN